jgi:hypothetical protein
MYMLNREWEDCIFLQLLKAFFVERNVFVQGLCFLSRSRAKRTLGVFTAKGLACRRSHSVVGGEEPTKRTQIGEVISAINEGRAVAIADGC